MGNHFRELAFTVLAALGISIPAPDFLGGMFLAISGGYLAAIWLPETSKREIRLRLLAAFLLSIMIASMHGAILPDWPVQVKMALGGFASGYIVAFWLKLLSRVAARGGDVGDEAVDKITRKIKKD